MRIRTSGSSTGGRGYRERSPLDDHRSLRAAAWTEIRRTHLVCEDAERLTRQLRRALYLTRFCGTPFTLASPAAILIRTDAYYVIPRDFSWSDSATPLRHRRRPRHRRRLSITANTVTSRISSNLFTRTRSTSCTGSRARSKWNRDIISRNEFYICFSEKKYLRKNYFDSRAIII